MLTGARANGNVAAPRWKMPIFLTWRVNVCVNGLVGGLGLFKLALAAAPNCGENCRDNYKLNNRESPRKDHSNVLA